MLNKEGNDGGGGGGCPDGGGGNDVSGEGAHVTVTNPMEIPLERDPFSCTNRTTEGVLTGSTIARSHHLDWSHW